MEWIINEPPLESGPYLVSISLQRTNGVFLFKYIAYYEQDENTWYKYDPFNENYNPVEPIQGYVIAWGENVTIHLG